MSVDIEGLDEGDGLEATMRRHHASWHKTCCLKFKQTQLDRLARGKEEFVEAREMKTPQEEEANFGMRRRSSAGRPAHKKFVSSVMSPVALQGFTLLALMTSTVLVS